jgi:MarR family 2-MHQ and catechol resistance regulon transcriptional repressor
MTTRIQDSVPPSDLWINLIRAHHDIEHHLERQFAQYELGWSDFASLNLLLHEGPLTITAIGKVVLLRSGSMTSCIDRLEKRGLVQRTADGSDRRVRMIGLSSEGHQLIVQAEKIHAGVLESIMSGLSGLERYQANQSLIEIASRVTALSKGA